MSIANLERRGLLNDDKQIIQRPVAFDKNQELSIYFVNFNNVDDTGTVVEGVLGSTFNQGTEGYLPERDETGIYVLENGLYNILLQVRNLDQFTSGAKYLFTVKVLGNVIVNQCILDLSTKGTINADERVEFNQNYLNVNLAPYYFTFECQCIEGTQTPKNFQGIFTITRAK